MNHDEASSITALFAFIYLETLRTKYGDEFLSEFCQKSEAYPIAGVAAIVLEANITMTCSEMAEMFKVADYPPQLKSLVGEACKDKAKIPKESIINNFLKLCNEKGLKEALESLTKVELEKANEKENELLTLVFGRLPQAIVYAQKYNADVSKPVMQSLLLLSMAISNELGEIREELERCRGG